MFDGARRLLGPILSFMAAGGLLTSGWYGFLRAIGAGMLSLFLPAVGLSVMSASWWFPFVRWSYKKYVYPMAPTTLPEPETLKYVFNPPSLIKAAIAVAVWFYTPLITYGAVRFLWNHLKPTVAPINHEALAFTDRQCEKAEKGEPLESSHNIPYPLQEVAEKLVDEIKQAKNKAERVYGAATDSNNNSKNNNKNESSSSSSSSSSSPSSSSSEGERRNKGDGKQQNTNTNTNSNVGEVSDNNDIDDEKDVRVNDNVDDNSDINLRNRKSKTSSQQQQQQQDKNKPTNTTKQSGVGSVQDKNKPNIDGIKPSAPSALYSQ